VNGLNEVRDRKTGKGGGKDGRKIGGRKKAGSSFFDFHFFGSDFSDSHFSDFNPPSWESNCRR
jgi:hypothetical protein